MTNLPDGFVLENNNAPAGLPEGFVLAHPVATASGDTWTDAKRFASTAAHNAAAGFLSLPRTLAEGADWAMRKLGYQGGASDALGSIQDPSQPGIPLFPTFQQAKDMAFNTTGATEYVPTSWAGHRGMDATVGLMTGGRNLLAGAASGAFGGQAAELFPNNPVAAALIGGAVGSKVGTALANTPERVANAVAGKNPNETYAAFDRLGLPTNLSGTVTGEPGLLYAEKLASRMPGSESAMATARERLVDAWRDKFDQTAAAIGKATNPTEAGMSLQSEAQNWLNNYKSTNNALWGEFRDTVPGMTPTKVSNFSAALDGVMKDFPDAKNLASVLQPPLAGRLKTALQGDTAAPVAPQPRASSILDESGAPIQVQPTAEQMASYLDAVKKSGTLPWQSLQAVRSRLGEMLENAEPVEGMSLSAVKRLYGALTEDMKAGAASVSPEATAAFNKASAYTRFGHGMLDDYLSPIIKATTPEQATQFALAQARQGGSRLGALQFAIPNAVNDLGSWALQKLATNEANPVSFSTALTGKKPHISEDAQTILFPSAVRQDIADLATTGQAMSPVVKDLGNSPTATHNARSLGRLYTAVELAKQGHDLAGAPGAVAGFGLGLSAPNVMGRIAQATALNPFAAKLAGTNVSNPFVPLSILQRLPAAADIGRYPQVNGLLGQ